MASLKQSDGSSFFELTNNAFSVFNLFHEDVRGRSPDHPIHFIEYYEMVDSENVIEIRFDVEKATLTCTFNEDKRCNASYLFYDNPLDVMRYIEYLNKNFTYDYLGSRWMIYHCFISIKRIDGITSFMLCK